MNIDFSGLNQIEVIITFIIGLLLLFAGYKLKKIAFFIIWFLIGYNLMGLFVPTLVSWVPAIDNNLWHILLPIAGGLLLALMGFTIEKVCVGGLAFGIVMMIGARFGTDIQTLAITAVIGIIAAGLAVMLMKPAIIIATALAGSYTITIGILFFAAGIISGTYYIPILIGIAAVGSIVQFLTTKNE